MMSILIVVFIIFIFIAVIHNFPSEKYIIKNGKRTDGYINKLAFQSITDNYGRTYVTLSISYSFRDRAGVDQMGTKNMDVSSGNSSCYRLNEGDTVTVSYLENRPYLSAIHLSKKI